MTKRVLSIMLALVLLTAVFVFPASADDNSDSNASYGKAGYYYVYTENGKGLNVRETPGGNIVGSLKYGTKIHVEGFVDSNWALIHYKFNKPGFGTQEYDAYVNRRFLTKKKPEAKPKTSGTATTAGSETDALTALNNEYRSATYVTPYEVTLRPTRVTGWVAMHWGPSTETEILATYKANATLTVVSETSNWLQVEDQEKGFVGFIKKEFVAQ